MIGAYPFRLLRNPRAGAIPAEVLPLAGFRAAAADIRGWPGYAPTPLHDLAAVAAAAGVGALALKDEAGRFGQASFAALGGAYAVARVLCVALARRGVTGAISTADLESGRFAGATQAITVTCATDGNHGRAVAWGAQRFGCRCVIFIHEQVSSGRAAAIARLGAEVRRVAGTADDSAREAERVAGDAGWQMVSDIARPGGEAVLCDIMQGTRVMADEAADAWSGAAPTHVFVPGEGGGCAAAVSAQMRIRYAPAPRLVVVEPEAAAGLFASAARAAPASLAWRELAPATTAFLAIPAGAAVDTMRLLARAGVVAGESGAVGLAGFLLAAADPAARDALGLDAASRVLVFSTEGASDPELYARLVGEPPRG